MRVFSQVASNIVYLNGWADFSPLTFDGRKNLNLLAQEAGEVLEICDSVVLFNLSEALTSKSEDEYYDKVKDVTPTEARAILDLARIVARIKLVTFGFLKKDTDVDPDSIGTLFNLNTGRSVVFKTDFDRPSGAVVRSKLLRRLSAKAGGITI